MVFISLLNVGKISDDKREHFKLLWEATNRSSPACKEACSCLGLDIKENLGHCMPTPKKLESLWKTENPVFCNCGSKFNNASILCTLTNVALFGFCVISVTTIRQTWFNASPTPEVIYCGLHDSTIMIYWSWVWFCHKMCPSGFKKVTQILR